MEWMLDSANLKEVRESLEIFPVSGVTTNPTILRSEGRIDYAKHLRELSAIVGTNRTFHVQAGVDGCENIVREAQRIQEIVGKDVYIKIPITEEGLKAIAVLKAQGTHITATAIYTAYQGLLAAQAGVDYLAPYCNRMEQFGIDFGIAIAQIRHIVIICLQRSWAPATRTSGKSYVLLTVARMPLLHSLACCARPCSLHWLWMQSILSMRIRLGLMRKSEFAA